MLPILGVRTWRAMQRTTCSSSPIPTSDFSNALMHTIVHEGLVDEDFIRSRTIGYGGMKRNVANYSPEAMAPVCGIPAETIREVARLYAKAKSSMILWGMGVSQHIHGTDNARCSLRCA